MGPTVRLRLSMKNFFHFFLLVVLLTSCKALKNATAKDNTASSQSKRNSNSNNSTFLEDISVTPGAKRTMISESSDSKKTYGTAANASKKNFDEENAAQVQLKYSSI